MSLGQSSMKSMNTIRNISPGPNSRSGNQNFCTTKKQQSQAIYPKFSNPENENQIKMDLRIQMRYF